MLRLVYNFVFDISLLLLQQRLASEVYNDTYVLDAQVFTIRSIVDAVYQKIKSDLDEFLGLNFWQKLSQSDSQPASQPASQSARGYT